MKDVTDGVRKHRQGLRADGLRPIQIWVPDIRRRGFAQECRKQSRKLHKDPDEVEVLKWLSKVSALGGWR